MTTLHVNLGCGPVYVDCNDWLNLDFTPATPVVKQANLLGRLPLANNAAAVVYSSHFLEHVPYTAVSTLLAECLRVLTPGGQLRLVLPDLENLCREYLDRREQGEHDKADFVVLEMIDQCVRSVPGGELGNLYRTLQQRNDPYTTVMMAYVRQRTGEDLRQNISEPSRAEPSRAEPKPRMASSSNGTRRRDWLRRLPARLQGRLLRTWIKLWRLGLPPAFRAQNLSLAGVGERHHWLWDFHQLYGVLQSVGFIDIERQDAAHSRIARFPLYPLDLDRDGRPRKGAESMYIEARKPG